MCVGDGVLGNRSIIDELHEGSIDYHLVLGLIKMMQAAGEAPLVLLTSATINKERIQSFFGIDDEDYLRIEGRAYPVEKSYLTEDEKVGVEYWDKRGRVNKDKNYLALTEKRTKEAARKRKNGDILVFLPGAPEIKDFIDRSQDLPDLEILPLHGSLSPAERDYALDDSSAFYSFGLLAKNLDLIEKLGSKEMSRIIKERLTDNKRIFLFEQRQKEKLCKNKDFNFEKYKNSKSYFEDWLAQEVAQEVQGVKLGHELLPEIARLARKKRIIVATNIAETSVTVPGVKIVVDSCRQRSVRFNPKTGIIEMGTEFISKGQAEQRAGRAGRMSNGECLRIVAEVEYQSLPDHPESEISRSNLAHLVLRLKGMGIDPEHFPFIEPPRPERITHGIEELKRLGALSEDGQLTAIGKEIGQLPFEPTIGRMLVEARRRKCLEAALIVAAFEREDRVLLGPTQQDVKESPGYEDDAKRKDARNKVQKLQATFARGGSDLLQSINIFMAALDQGMIEAMRRDDRSPEGRYAQDKFRKWCKDHYVKPEALTHIAHRLKDYAHYAGLKLDYSELKKQLQATDDAALGAVILAGHPDRILYLSSTGRGMASYRRLGDPEGKTVNISPGSGAFDAQPQLCIAGTISEGRGSFKGGEITRNYASHVHPITGAQIREVLPHLVVEKAGEPRYNPKTDQVEMTVNFRPNQSALDLGHEQRVVTGDQASQAFAYALANGQVDLPCYEYNKNRLAELEILYHRSRGRVKKPDSLSTWYKERVGDLNK